MPSSSSSCVLEIVCDQPGHGHAEDPTKDCNCKDPCEPGGKGKHVAPSGASSRGGNPHGSNSGGTAAPEPPEASTEPIRYATGEIVLSETDVASQAFGTPWGHTRSYVHRQVHQQTLQPIAEDRGQGWNWQVQQWPYLVRRMGGQGQVLGYVVQGQANAQLWFDLSGGNLTARFGGKETLAFDRESWTFILKDPSGNATNFAAFDQIESGMFLCHTDPGGVVTKVVAFQPNGRQIGEVQRTDGNVVESLLYAYGTFVPGDGRPRLTSVTLRRKEGAGNWGTVSAAAYGYYGPGNIPGDEFGSLGDLKSVSVEGMGGGTPCTTFYRYYKGSGSSSSSSAAGSSSSSAGGGQHLLKYVVSGASHERFVQAGNHIDYASDAVVAQYADFYFEYDGKRRVTREIVQGGSRSYTFEYTTSAHADNPNNWKFKTIENLPGGDRNIVYSNHAGQVMLRELENGANSWLEYYQYDGDFRITLAAQASAINGYSAASADLAVSLKANDGLIHLLAYHPPTGELLSHRIKRGSSGTPIKLWEREFGAHTEVFSSDPSSSSSGASSSSAASGSSSSSSSSRPPQCPVPRRTVYAQSKQIDYPDDVDQTKKIETSFSYTWHADTVQVRERVTTLPVVATSQNGSGTAATRVEQFDRFGHPTWLKDERGFITYFEFQAHSGGLLKRIDDVDTSQVVNEPAGWTTPAGGGLHLVTDYEVDGLGRVTQELGPSHTVDIGGVATVVRRASWSVYKDCNTEVRHGQGYATGTAPNYTYTLVNPVSITKFDKSGNVIEEISATRSSTSGKLTAGDSFPQTSYVRWTTHQYTECCKLASTRLYHLIPGSGAGTEGNQYSQTNFGYDIRNRRNRVVSPGGTITKTIFDARSLPTQILVGTSDANLVAVADYEYDSAADGGDGNLTKQTEHVDGLAANDRITSHAYDWRNRRTSTDGEIDFYQKSYFDNFDRVTKSERYDTTSSGNLLARSETKYDDRGRVFRTVRYAVNPATGSVGNSLTDDTWFDAAGNVIKHFPAGSKAFTKAVFNGLGRQNKRFIGYDTAETSFSDAGNVTGDTIFEQVETLYDAASNVIQTTVRRRFHNATGTGELTTPSGSQPKARVSYVALYPDGVGRQQAVADYGTNGGSAFTRSSVIPARSDTVLVTSTEFNSDGEGFKTIDPMATQTRAEFDDLGRQTKLIENYIDGDPATGTADQDRTTVTAYNADGQVKTLTAKNPTTGDQVTKYIYGSTLAESGVASSQLLRAVIYPDSDDADAPLGNGADGIYDRVQYKYNRQGERFELKDQRETVHVYDHDKLGRLVHDRVTELGSPFGTPVFSSSSSGSSSSSAPAGSSSSSSSSSGPGHVVDGSVRRISRTYEVRGMLKNVTSHDNPTVGAGNVVNDVQFVYNSFGQLVTEYQEHAGAVSTSTSPKVQYAYADGAANHVRRTKMTYPNGRILRYEYNSGADDNLGRVTFLADDNAGAVGTHLAEYTYLGLGTVVQVDYTEPDIRNDLASGSGDDPYDGFDRFDRVVDCLWRNYGTSTDVERIKHGHDRASNRLWRENTVAPAGFDELYSYDGLYQLKDFDRGDLNAGKDAITGLTFVQEWLLDATGNWSNFKEDADGNGIWDLDQPRSHNRANEITAITATIGADWVDPDHDRAGNMVVIPQPAAPTSSYSATWDAWNRLVKLIDGASTVGEYAYDGLFRRTKKTVSGVVRHFYYSDRWQVLEERLGASNLADRQFVWGLRYIDDLVARDRDTDSSGSLDERLYSLHDANWNAVSLSNSAGNVVERYCYAAYGTPRALDASFTPRSGGSAYGWENLFAGYQRDAESDLYHVRYRFLLAEVGSWLVRDLTAYSDGMNLYQYVRSSPTNFVDPIGQQMIFAQPAPIFTPRFGPVAPGFPRIYVPPPRPVVPAPPVPGPIVTPPQAAEPEPVGPNPAHVPADRPFKKPWKCPGKGQRPDSDCTEKELARLTNNVNQSCPHHRGPDFPECSVIYSFFWSCEAIEDLRDKWKKCCAARRKREYRCFRGGNFGHRKALRDCHFQVEYCYYLLRKYNCPGYRQGPLFTPVGPGPQIA